jgi:hypothetical protein
MPMMSWPLKMAIKGILLPMDGSYKAEFDRDCVVVNNNIIILHFAFCVYCFGLTLHLSLVCHQSEYATWRVKILWLKARFYWSYTDIL